MAAQQEQQIVVFELADALYGVDIRSVREIIRHEPIRKVPNTPPAVNGVIDLRGLVIPVADLRRRLRVPASPIGERTRIIVVDIAGSMMGFIVDAVAEVLRLPVSAVEAAPAMSVTDGSNYIAGVAKTNDRLLMLIDVERALSAEALKRFAEEEQRRGEQPVDDLVGDVLDSSTAALAPVPLRPALHDLDVELLEATFEAVKPRAAELVEFFYSRLFEQYPSVIPLFAGADMREQQGKLLSALALVVASLRQPDALVPALQRLGEKHLGYGAVPAHYDAVGGVLLETLAHIAGDAWTDEAESAWSDAFAVVAGVMIDAAEAATERAA